MPRRELRLVPVDPEIEKTCRRNRKSKQDQIVGNSESGLVEMATNGNGNGGNGGVVEDQAAGLHP